MYEIIQSKKVLAKGLASFLIQCSKCKITRWRRGPKSASVDQLPVIRCNCVKLEQAVSRMVPKLRKRRGCIEWTGKLSKGGYAVGVAVRIGNKVLNNGHRIMWYHRNGPVPDHLEIDHKCRNPKCVNVNHLRLMTPVKNVMIGNSPHAVNARKTHCVRGHKFDKKNTGWWKKGSGVFRACRACKRYWNRKNKIKRLLLSSSLVSA